MLLAPAAAAAQEFPEQEPVQAAPPAPSFSSPLALRPPPATLSIKSMGVNVRFEAKTKGSYRVSVGDTACRVPCDMYLPPGRYHVGVAGDASFGESVYFPAEPTVVIIEKHDASMATLGAVGLWVGIPMTIAGAIVAGAGADQAANFDASSTAMYVGLGMLAFGVVFATVCAGVGYGTAGKDRLHLEGGYAEDSRKGSPLKLVGLGVAPTTNGGATMGARFIF